MLLKNIYTSGVTAMLILLFCISSGCSREKETKINKGILLNEPKQQDHAGRFGALPEKKGTLTLGQQDEQKRKIQIRTIEGCQKEFESCTEKCGNDECEEWCLQELSSCEIGLSKEIQTLKQ